MPTPPQHPQAPKTRQETPHSPRKHRHRSCGLRTTKPPPHPCARCDVIDAYQTRRQQYLDEVEQSEPANLLLRPIHPVVTFGWWLQQHPYPPPPKEHTP